MALEAPETIRVELGGRSYDVLVGAGLLDDIASHAEGFLKSYGSRPVPIVADTNARKHHGAWIEASLGAAGYAAVFSICTTGDDF